MQVAKLIEQRASKELSVKGMDYPPPPGKLRIAKMVSMLQMSIFGYTFMGDKIFQAVGAVEPEFLQALHQNKMSAFMFTWLVGNMVQSNLYSTQAFEIYQGGKLVWSSLDKKRVPGMRDLIDSFQKTDVEFILDGQPR